MGRLVADGFSVAFTLVLALTSVSATLPSGQFEQKPTFRSRVTLVPIDVRVVDGRGQAVSDLAVDDFAVAEGGVTQRISHFERHKLTPESPDSCIPPGLRSVGALDLRPQNRRVFLIALPPDVWLPWDRFDLAKAIKTFLVDRLLPQDCVALWAYDRATDLTTDHAAVAEVFERLRAYLTSIETLKDTGKRWSLMKAFFDNAQNGRPLPDEIQQALTAVFETERAPVRSVPRMPAREFAGLVDQVVRHGVDKARRAGALARDSVYASHWSNRVLIFLNLIQYLRYIEGEKHLVYLSGGTMPSLEDDRSIARVASDAQVVLHFVVNGMGGDASSQHIAELTGGQFFSAEYPDRVLATIDQRTRVWYTLGYYPSDARRDGRYRDVRVTVRRPRHATVLYRSSYQATDEPAPHDRRPFVAQDRIIGAAQYRATLSELTLSVTAAAAPKSVSAVVVVDVSRLKLEVKDGRRVGTVEVAFFCHDAKDREVGQIWKKINLALTEDTYRRLLKEGLRQAVDIPTPGGRARYLKVVALDYLSERLGSSVIQLQ